MRFFILTGIFISVLSFTFAQEQKQIDERQQDLSSLRNEISDLENKLKDINLQELNQLDHLEDLSRQELLLNKMINKLEKEGKYISAEIVKTGNEIRISENEVKDLREKYSEYVVWLYKQGDNKMINLLLGSESVNQAMMRYKYLDYLTDKNETALNDILSHQKKLRNLKAKLVTEKNKKQKYAKDQKSDLAKLQVTKEDKKTLLIKLKNDEKYITGEIQRRRLAEIEIKRIIEKLIEEKRRKEIELATKRLKEKNLKTPPELDYANLKEIDSAKGFLSWPVKRGRIIRDFGENRNEKLNTVTLNYGIDILVRDSLNVYPVAEGIISAIDWIPGYGSVIIVTHKNEFRTVYGHLSDIPVNEGDKVNPTIKIGKVNSSLEGSILHFELWNERNYQDPKDWLVKK